MAKEVFPGEDPEGRDELARLPHGRHGLPAEFVAKNQRERLIAAFAQIVEEQGYWGVTIQTVTSEANVSSRTFYKYFESVEDCYLAAFERAVEWIRGPVIEAYEAEEEWPAAIAAALEALLGHFARFQAGGRLLTAEPFVAGPKIALRHKELIEEMVPYLRRGRELGGEALPESTERGLLGAASAMIGRHLFGGREGDLEDLGPDLAAFILKPYLGAEAAQQARS